MQQQSGVSASMRSGSNEIKSDCKLFVCARRQVRKPVFPIFSVVAAVWKGTRRAAESSRRLKRKKQKLFCLLHPPKMCDSLTKTLFFISLVVGSALVLASIVTPAWRNYPLQSATDSALKGDFSLGLLTKLCGDSTTSTGNDLVQKCVAEFEVNPLFRS